MSLPIKIFFGGSFNPVHNGHASLAREVIAKIHPASFSFVPCKVWPYKQVAAIEDRHRLAMLNLLLQEFTAEAELSATEFLLDHLELNKDGKSYTCQTLAQLQQAYPDFHLVWILGMDSWLNLNKWHEWRTLTDHGSLLVVNRPGFPQFEDMAISPEQRHWAESKVTSWCELSRSGSVAFMEIVPVEVSSTLVRDKASENNDDWQQLLPRSVCEYIKEHQIYQ